MVVQKTFKDSVEDKRDASFEESDSERRNDTENRNGVVTDRLENSGQNVEESLDEEPEAIDLSR
jgi:hypothetical protein